MKPEDKKKDQQEKPVKLKVMDRREAAKTAKTISDEYDDVLKELAKR